MKKIKLATSPVVFNEEEHTYTLGGQTLSGITSIIHKYIFPDMYAGVSEGILKSAAERGHRIHEELQMQFLGMPLSEPSIEVAAYNQIAKQHKLKQIAAEHLVDDEWTVEENGISTEKGIATCIDSVLQTGDKSVALVDYKTTYKLNIEYLQWQLSIEAELFELQNPRIEVSKLYAVHMPRPKDGDEYQAALVEIQRLPKSYVYDLIGAYLHNAEAFDNPLHQLSDTTTELLMQYKSNEASIADLQAELSQLTAIKQAILSKLKEEMDGAGMKELTTADGSIKATRRADSVRKTFSLDTLKGNCPEFPAEWLSAIKDKGYKTTTVAGSVVITIK